MWGGTFLNWYVDACFTHWLVEGKLFRLTRKEQYVCVINFQVSTVSITLLLLCTAFLFKLLPPIKYSKFSIPRFVSFCLIFSELWLFLVVVNTVISIMLRSFGVTSCQGTWQLLMNVFGDILKSGQSLETLHYEKSPLYTTWCNYLCSVSMNPLQRLRKALRVT